MNWERASILFHSPRRFIFPIAHGVGGPRGVLVKVAGRARIRNLVFIRHGRSDKSERVSADEHTGNLRLNFGHMAGHAGAAWRSILVMRMFRERCLARPVSGAG